MKFSGADNENPLVPLVHPMGNHPNHYFLAIHLARPCQGEIVNILLKIKNSFLPTKQILIGL
ncbi:hypothetical protein NUK31_19900, partial [Aeromonas caviae]|uniref:hypothetical protein n=1 Tax=Aeromonas caviae TaxID=648 RepID=UPI00214F593C